jgi:hypothetical protein
MGEVLLVLSNAKDEWETADKTGTGSKRFLYCMKAIAILNEIIS